MITTKNTLSCFSLVVFCVASSMAQAQSNLRPPAEVPPSSYSGSQYVDSTGCVYVRAGSSGSVTWVPRVTRDRQPVCGFQPSLTTATAARSTTQPVLVQAKPAPLLDPVVVPPSGAQGTQPASSQTRFFPEHLINERRALSTVETPKEFRPAWTDNRLNPKRAEQTLAGQEQMRQIWTDTVPRRLVD